MHPKRARSFTLVEQIVVILIISVLASIAIPQYLRGLERVRVTEAMSMLFSIRTTQERFVSSEGNYVRTNMNAGSFGIILPGEDPAYGMKNFFMVLGPGDPAGCQPGTPLYNVMFIRITDNTGVSTRYFKNYSLLYERCADKISWPGCPNCAQDFR